MTGAARFALFVACAPAAAAQGWTTRPAHPSVGDTVWIAGVVDAPAGWTVRPGALPADGDVAPLGDPLVRAAGGGRWDIEYPVAAWVTGDRTVTLPPVWRLGPGGAADSVPGGTVTFTVRSVLTADTGTAAAPKPPLVPLRVASRRPFVPAAAGVVALALLGAALSRRRRPPRPLGGAPASAPAPAVPDERWLAAGEPRAVAARAAHEVRIALGRAVADVPPALATTEALAAAEGRLPPAHFRELRDVLLALDQVEFAAVHGGAVGALAARARRLAAELGT